MAKQPFWKCLDVGSNLLSFPSVKAQVAWSQVYPTGIQSHFTQGKYT